MLKEPKSEAQANALHQVVVDMLVTLCPLHSCYVRNSTEEYVALVRGVCDCNSTEVGRLLLQEMERICNKRYKRYTRGTRGTCRI